MPYDRNSADSRKSKSAARAARHREQLGIPEWAVALAPDIPDAMAIVPAALPPVAEVHVMHDQVPSAIEKEPEMDGDDLIAAIDELLASVSHPVPPEEAESQTAAKSSDTCGSTPAASSSLATAGSVANGMERSEPLEPTREMKVEERNERPSEDEEFVLEMLIQEEEALQP